MRFVAVGLQLKGEYTMKKLKVTITLDMKCVNDCSFLSLKEISENVMSELECNTRLIPWDQGYKGKFSVRVEDGKDHFTSWCLLEEIKECADKYVCEFKGEKGEGKK